MRSLLIFLPVLACPLLMGACMFFMSRGMRKHDEPAGDTTDVAELRREVERLRAEVGEPAPER